VIALAACLPQPARSWVTVGRMPAKKRPGPEDAITARQILLDGLAADRDPRGLVGELAPLHPRNNTFPGEVFLRVAADALDWCGAKQPCPTISDSETIPSLCAQAGPCLVRFACLARHACAQRACGPGRPRRSGALQPRWQHRYRILLAPASRGRQRESSCDPRGTRSFPITACPAKIAAGPKAAASGGATGAPLARSGPRRYGAPAASGARRGRAAWPPLPGCARRAIHHGRTARTGPRGHA
jgi:hypothetical protein